MGKKGCSKIQNTKLNTYDWLCDVPDAENATDYVEVQFKNTRERLFPEQLQNTSRKRRYGRCRSQSRT